MRIVTEWPTQEQLDEKVPCIRYGRRRRRLRRLFPLVEGMLSFGIRVSITPSEWTATPASPKDIPHAG